MRGQRVEAVVEHVDPALLRRCEVHRENAGA